MEITSAPCSLASNMPCNVQEKKPLPPRSKQRLNGVSDEGGVIRPGATATARSTLMLRIFASGATPIISPVLGPAAPAANDEVQVPWPTWSTARSRRWFGSAGSGTSQFCGPKSAELYEVKVALKIKLPETSGCAGFTPVS